MILLFAAPPYQPMLINSVLAIPIPRPVFGPALVAHLSSEPQPKGSVERERANTPDSLSL